MKNITFLKKLIELFIVSDEHSKHWLTVPILRQMSYWIGGIGLVNFGIFLLIILSPLGSILQTSPGATLFFRFFRLGVGLSLLGVTLAFSFMFFRHLITEGGQILFVDIVNFYFLSLFVFFFNYSAFYYLWPHLLSIEQPTIDITTTIVTPSLESYRLNLDLMLFTAFQSVNSYYFKVRPSSTLISFLTYMQSLYTLVLIALVVSSYVNKRTATK